jgi:hypothetical protein
MLGRLQHAIPSPSFSYSKFAIKLPLTPTDFDLGQRIIEAFTAKAVAGGGSSIATAATLKLKAQDRADILRMLELMVIPAPFSSFAQPGTSQSSLTLPLCNTAKQYWPNHVTYLMNVIKKAQAIALFAHCPHKACTQCTASYFRFTETLAKVRPHLAASNRLNDWRLLIESIALAHRKRRGLVSAVRTWESMQPQTDHLPWYDRVLDKERTTSSSSSHEEVLPTVAAEAYIPTPPQWTASDRTSDVAHVSAHPPLAAGQAPPPSAPQPPPPLPAHKTEWEQTFVVDLTDDT